MYTMESVSPAICPWSEGRMALGSTTFGHVGPSRMVWPGPKSDERVTIVSPLICCSKGVLGSKSLPSILSESLMQDPPRRMVLPGPKLDELETIVKPLIC